MDYDENGRFVGFTVDTWHDKYMVTARFRVAIAGRAEPVALCIERVDGLGVAANQVRQLPIGDMVAESRKAKDWQAEVIAVFQEQHAGQPTAAARTRATWVGGGPQRGRSATTEDLEQVAAIYRQAWADNESVNKAVKTAFRLSASGAAKRIMAARKAGLLKGVGPT